MEKKYLREANMIRYETISSEIAREYLAGRIGFSDVFFSHDGTKTLSLEDIIQNDEIVQEMIEADPDAVRILNKMNGFSFLKRLEAFKTIVLEGDSYTINLYRKLKRKETECRELQQQKMQHEANRIVQEKNQEELLLACQNIQTEFQHLMFILELEQKNLSKETDVVSGYSKFMDLIKDLSQGKLKEKIDRLSAGKTNSSDGLFTSNEVIDELMRNAERKKTLIDREAREIEARRSELETIQDKLQTKENELNQQTDELNRQMAILKEAWNNLKREQAELKEAKKTLEQRQTDFQKEMEQEKKNLELGWNELEKKKKELDGLHVPNVETIPQ